MSGLVHAVTGQAEERIQAEREKGFRLRLLWILRHVTLHCQ